MKAKWLLVPITAILVSCDKKEPSVPETTPRAERKLPAPTRIEPVNEPGSTLTPQTSAPEKPAEAPASDATKAQAPSPSKPPGIPTAQAVEGKPGYVFSPYNNKVIDVRDMPPGTLVADPMFPTSEKKYFRTPD